MIDQFENFSSIRIDERKRIDSLSNIQWLIEKHHKTEQIRMIEIDFPSTRTSICFFSVFEFRVLLVVSSMEYPDHTQVTSDVPRRHIENVNSTIDRWNPWYISLWWLFVVSHSVQTQFSLFRQKSKWKKIKSHLIHQFTEKFHCARLNDIDRLCSSFS